ncbi:uncharacterized protein LOC131222318 [Magnolia sinica]|uniref:uncharacterized protein LOC131222318 n=1 Tax=Magnolia sinica TaxID=86752 RepID=UPI00265852DA|nr:uncharacterized protein LOC131222318 [Magnolia sinica]
MEGSKYSWDLILVSMSFCFTIAYHAFLWHSFKNKHPLTTSIGANTMMRRKWFQMVMKDNEKNTMLVLQSLRNSIMRAILISSLAILLNSSLAAQTNNAYKSRLLLRGPVYGSWSGPTLALKWAVASIFLLFSFLCNSMAVGYFSDAGFLVYVAGELPSKCVQSVIERGSMLASVGARMLYVTVPLLLWMFGPMTMALASVAMVWVLYELDFASSGLMEGLSDSSTVCWRRHNDKIRK